MELPTGDYYGSHRPGSGLFGESLVAVAIPLFGFYRDLLRWLFLSPDEPAPTFDAVEIVVRD